MRYAVVNDAEIEAEFDRRMRLTAEAIAAKARDICPVDSGALQASIHVEGGGGDYSVIADVSYAEAVEYGTSKMAAQPYLRPAVELARAEIEAIWS